LNGRPVTSIEVGAAAGQIRCLSIKAATVSVNVGIEPEAGYVIDLSERHKPLKMVDATAKSVQ
jgi:hypothetical protein